MFRYGFSAMTVGYNLKFNSMLWLINAWAASPTTLDRLEELQLLLHAHRGSSEWWDDSWLIITSCQLNWQFCFSHWHVKNIGQQERGGGGRNFLFPPLSCQYLSLFIGLPWSCYSQLLCYHKKGIFHMQCKSVQVSISKKILWISMQKINETSISNYRRLSIWNGFVMR